MLESFLTDEFKYEKLTEAEQQKRGILGRLVGVIADSANPTRNGRKYGKELWEKLFSNPIMQERINNRCCFGELGHPSDREETNIEKIAICLAEVPKFNKQGQLCGVFDILNTPNGRILKSLCDYGCNIGVSSRGSGDIITDFDGQESVDPETYTCEGWDAVLIPAVKAARPKYVNESLDRKRYNKTLRQKLEESLKSASDDDRRVMQEGLTSIGIDLNEDVTSSYGFVTDSDYKEFVKVSALLNDILSKYDEAIDDIENNAVTDEDKEALESDPKYQLLIKTYQDNYEVINELAEIIDNGSLHIDKDQPSDKIMLNMQLFTVDDLYQLASDLKAKLSNASLKEALVDEPKYFKLQTYTPGNPEDGVEEDRFDIWRVVQADSLEDAENILASDKENFGGDILEATEDEFNEYNEYAGSFTTYVNKSDEDENIEEIDLAVDNTEAIEEELQKLLAYNNSLEKKIIDLQEELSVGNTKDKEIEEYKQKYFNMAARLSETTKKLEAFKTRNSSLEEKYEKQSKLLESYKSAYADQKDKVKELKTSLKESINSANNIDSLKESYEKEIGDLKKSSSISIKEYDKKLANNKQIIESLKKKVNNVITRYINNKAQQTGCSVEDITSRLSENYSLDDIDKICEELDNYNLSLNNLPFSTLNENFVFKAKPSDREPILNIFKNPDDEIDDQLKYLMRDLR